MVVNKVVVDELRSTVDVLVITSVLVNVVELSVLLLIEEVFVSVFVVG